MEPIKQQKRMLECARDAVGAQEEHKLKIQKAASAAEEAKAAAKRALKKFEKASAADTSAEQQLQQEQSALPAIDDAARRALEAAGLPAP